LNVENQDCNMD